MNINWRACYSNMLEFAGLLFLWGCPLILMCHDCKMIHIISYQLLFLSNRLCICQCPVLLLSNVQYFNQGQPTNLNNFSLPYWIFIKVGENSKSICIDCAVSVNYRVILNEERALSNAKWKMNAYKRNLFFSHIMSMNWRFGSCVEIHTVSQCLWNPYQWFLASHTINLWLWFNPITGYRHCGFKR